MYIFGYINPRDYKTLGKVSICTNKMTKDYAGIMQRYYIVNGVLKRCGFCGNLKDSREFANWYTKNAKGVNCSECIPEILGRTPVKKLPKVFIVYKKENSKSKKRKEEMEELIAWRMGKFLKD